MQTVPTRRSILGFAAALTACPLCSIRSARAADDHHGTSHWSYEGDTGPAHWGALSPEYRACSLGTQQTPIDLQGAIEAQVGALDIAYQTMPLTILNNGHTIQVNTPPGSKLTIDGTAYELFQFHFHHPSEHLLAGKHFEMELHLVHRAAAGGLAVLGVLITPGAANPALAPIWAAMPPHEAPPRTIPDSTIEPARLLPADRTYFRYMGSLSTPPCTEGLVWTVLRSPIEASHEQIHAFATVFPMNARPPQSLHHRFVLES